MDGNYFEVNLAGQRLRVRAGDANYRHRYLWGGNRHSHGEYELHVLLSGKVQMEVGKERYQLTAGTAMMIAPGLYHKPKAEQGDMERFSMQILVPKGPLSENLQKAVSDCQVFSAQKSLCQICTDYYYETAAMNAYRWERQQALLTMLLIEVFRILGAEPMLPKKEITASPLERKIAIDSFFGKNFSTDAKQEELAAWLHISPRQLSRFLQKHYGTTFREMLIRARMDQAAWLLRTTEKPVPRIAEQVGYKSESAFYKAFFRQHNATPQQYRKENKGE